LNIAGGAAWWCSVWSHESLTGSSSKAMDKATCRGMRSQRIRCCASVVNCRQRKMVSVHFMVKEHSRG
jgi:hypothetical protein